MKPDYRFMEQINDSIQYRRQSAREWRRIRKAALVIGLWGLVILLVRLVLLK